MYSVTQIQVNKNHKLYGYCDKVTHAVNNMYNVTMFHIRQVMTAVQKEPKDLTENERQVMDAIKKVVTGSDGEYTMPTKKKYFLSYKFLDYFFKITNNPDYYCAELPAHVRQNAIKKAVTDMKSFFASIRAYKKNPSAFTGKPKLPHYKKSGGNSTAYSSNQECVVKPGEDDTFEVKLPKTDIKCKLGTAGKGTLKQVEIVPSHDIFVLVFVFEQKDVPQSETHEDGICSIDFGVNNIAAITNNIGKPCLLFKGNVLKSVNQWYNKEMARIQSEQILQTGKKFFSSNQVKHLCTYRNNYVNDFMRKVAKAIILWCVVNKIDTIVLGVNKLWKQRIDIGHINNQNFVEIPFNKLRFYIAYNAEKHGIRVVEQEESYTSKASFIDDDFIPVYEKGVKVNHKFSGRRIKRGVYKTADKTTFSADLNGSANIGRKAFPELFNREKGTFFNDIIVYRHPDIMLKEFNKYHKT